MNLKKEGDGVGLVQVEYIFGNTKTAVEIFILIFIFYFIIII